MTTVTVTEEVIDLTEEVVETVIVTVAEQGPPGVAGSAGADHGELTGLSDDDHSQYHNDTRGDLRYAPLAKGVTNGDLHDHSGGDGAQIAYSSLSGLPTLGTAAATASTDYAPASHDHAATYAPLAKGVTSGDSHDHSGGDGAQISYSTLSNLPTLGTAAATAATDYATAAHNHSGTYEPADATLLRQSDVDDTPVDGVTTAPVSSNWAYDHAALTTAHGISLFGASLVDDASALAARTTLGVPSLHGFEGRTGSSLSLTGAVLTLNITSQTVWLNGVAYPRTSSLTCDLGTPTVGLHYIVAQDDGAGALELVELVGAWSITNLTYTPVAAVYWSGSAGVVHEERHGHTRNLQLHVYLHRTVGARIQNDGSFAQTRPTTVNDGQIELVAGSLWDEDIESAISTAQCKLVRTWYETANGVWTFTDGVNNSGYDRPYLWNSGTSLLRYPNSGSAYALTDVASNRFIPVWVYASNDTTRPIYVVTPALSATYTTVANARAATAPALPFAAEVKLLYRWIYRGDGEYQEAADYRTASSLPSGGVAAPVATSVVFSPSGTIAATNVQAALEELDSEKLAVGLSFINEVMNFPANVGIDIDLDAANQWWGKVGTPTAAVFMTDVAGESGITETYEWALETTTDASGEGFYQRYTYADQPRVKAGCKLSAMAAIWVGTAGRTVTMELTTSASTTVTATATTQGWTICRCENLTLDGTYVDLKFTVDGADTFYVVPLGCNIGERALTLPSRNLRFCNKATVDVVSLTGKGDEATWTDVDCTSNTSNLAALLNLRVYLGEDVEHFALYMRRNGSSESLGEVTKAGGQVYGDAEQSWNSFQFLCDDEQIVEYYLDRISGTGTLLSGGIQIESYWEWE